MKNFIVLYSQKRSYILNDDLLNTHIDFLKKLHVDNKLSICGPLVDKKGAVLVIKAPSISEAEEIINQDPFIRKKYYEKYTIQEFMAANAENNWLSDVKPTKK